MIDLHVHLLPGLDDGPPDPDESLEMCRLCWEDGVRTVVATPHIVREVYENDRASILQAAAGFQALLRERQIPLRVLPGADVRLEHDTPERLERGELCTINDGRRYLLIELPDVLSEQGFARSLAALRKKGVIPIVSHPERIPLFQENPEAMYTLVYSGVPLQVTAHSLTGGFGKPIRALTERMLDRRLVHLIASDAHSAKTRPPGLRAALDRAIQIVGEAEARKLVEGNPGRILEGKPLDLPTPTPWKKQRRSWWRFGR